MSSQTPSYRGYRFPPEIISHAVWLYHRFSLSFRDAEDLLAQRGITVTYETIRQWCLTFGPTYARTLRRHRGRLGDTWYLDEVFATIQGQRRYLWRAVDQDGDLLDILVQSRRNRRAAIRFFRKVLGIPRPVRLGRRTEHRRERRLRLAQRDPAFTQRAGLHDVTPCHRRRPLGSAGVGLAVLQSANLCG